MHMGRLFHTVPLLAVARKLSHEPLFLLKFGDLASIMVLVRSWKEGLHTVVFEFGLGRQSDLFS